MTFFGRIVFLLLIAAAAVGLGAASAERVTRSFPGFVPISAESWRGYPGLATAAADPYARANLARSGKLAIADTEGIEFTASVDADGALLRASCNYQVIGNVPANRLWTFRVKRTDHGPGSMKQFPNVTSSRLHARTENVDINLNVGRQPAGLNWHRVSEATDARIVFVLTFYDSAVATTASFTDLEMPTVNALGCLDG